VTILCKINVPGFAVSVVIGVLYFSSTLIGIFTVDKVCRTQILSQTLTWWRIVADFYLHW